ncbi:MAG: hypothetical protein KAJ92_06085 [Gammaproteobacteria bacterium]|nr:hypothetical protein [Gammaproteobacteria bacterium]MCK5263235.1 hypothetical protein [Gammaproteobacteria bacterium]
MFLNALLFSAATVAASPKFPLVVNHELMSIEFAPRKPEQMGSFYEARGFPREMREVLKQQCFITVKIHNNSQKKIWLDLANWQFSVNGKPLKREHRDVWKQHWQAMNVPLRFQSTFRWTLIPETLDYLPGEEEGGNLVLPFTKEKITLDAKFATGENRDGKPIHIHFEQLYCAEDAL